MNKNALEIYNKIVSAPIGERVFTNHANGKNYGMESYLTDQGYKRNVDFSEGYDFNRHEAFIIKLADIRPYEEPAHDIKVGAIFYNSWGYDQTNIDFYQVVSVTAKTVTIREVRAVDPDMDYSAMSGKKSAKKDDFCSEPIRKTPFFFMGRWCLNFEHGGGGLWDGKPMRYSWYA